MSGEEILIAKVSCGSYLLDDGNIGHEIIDFFDADDGARYLYIAPDGKVGKSRSNIKAVLLIRSIGNTFGEVVGLACDLEDVQSSTSGEGLLPVKYGGVSVSEIFAENTYKEKKDVLSNLTYRAGSFKVPRSETGIFVTVGPAKNKDKNGKPIELNRSEKLKTLGHQRRYISSMEHPEAYERLKKLIADEQKWEERVGKGGIESSGEPRGDKVKTSFLEIIRKEDDELVFSNLLAHYLRCSEKGFQKFANEVLGIEKFGSHPEIFRESKHDVDLWIENDQFILVIENKIHSAINGIEPDDPNSQLDKYRGEAESEAKNKGKTVECYVFAPESNNVDINKVETAGYKFVSYKKLHKFFKENDSLFKDDYYDEFLWGLERHALTSAERNHRIMMQRFYRMIAKAKESGPRPDSQQQRKLRA